jgi:hypothetical protein
MKIRETFEACAKSGALAPLCFRRVRRRFIRPAASNQQSQTVHHYDNRAAFVSDYSYRQGDLADQGKHDQDYNCAKGYDQVLANDPAGALAETKGRQKIFQSVVHEDDVGLFEGSV